MPNSNPVRYRLVDSYTAKVEFTPPPTRHSTQESFVMQWMFDALNQSDENLLLKHEQGHYDISALITRDYFVDVMLLKGQTFTSATAGQTSITQLKDASVRKIQKVQTLYDSECHPEQAQNNYNGTKQKEWNDMFHAAFHVARSTGTTGPGPNGTSISHKVRLIDLILASGRTIP